MKRGVRSQARVISYASRDYKGKKDSKLESAPGGPRRVSKEGAGENDQICVERQLTNRLLEVEATGVRLCELKAFSEGGKISEEVEQFLTSGRSSTELGIPEDNLRLAAEIFLETEDPRLFELDNLKEVLVSLSEVREMWQGDRKLSPELVYQIAENNIIDILNSDPKLWVEADSFARSEIFIELLRFKDVPGAVETIARNIEALEERDFNYFTLALALNSGNPVATIEEFAKTGNLGEIPALPVIEVVRCLTMALIDSNGEVNADLVAKLRDSVSIASSRHGAHVANILNLLENNPKFKDLIEGVGKPGENIVDKEVHDMNIRLMLQLPLGHEVTDLDAKRAVLHSVLSDLRQGNVGSCFGTALAIAVHDGIPHLMVEDISSIFKNGYFVRNGRTEDGKVVAEKYYPGSGLNVSNELKDWVLNNDEVSKLSHRLASAFPEYADIFLKMIDWAEQDEEELKLVINLAVSALSSHFGLTQEDVEAEPRLAELSEEIRRLSVEDSLNDNTSRL